MCVLQSRRKADAARSVPTGPVAAAARGSLLRSVAARGRSNVGGGTYSIRRASTADEGCPLPLPRAPTCQDPKRPPPPACTRRRAQRAKPGTKTLPPGANRGDTGRTEDRAPRDREAGWRRARSGGGDALTEGGAAGASKRGECLCPARPQTQTKPQEGGSGVRPTCHCPESWNSLEMVTILSGELGRIRQRFTVSRSL